MYTSSPINFESNERLVELTNIAEQWGAVNTSSKYGRFTATFRTHEALDEFNNEVEWLPSEDEE